MDENDAIKCYEYFYNRINKGEFNITRTDRQLKTINNFLKLFGNRTKYDLYEFVCFQFSRIYEQETKLGSIQLNWIFGKKAFSYWRERSDAQVYYMRVFKQTYKIKNPLSEKIKINTGDYYNNERLRFLNKERGFLHCQDIGISFREDNEICLKCKFNNICHK